VVTIGTAHDNIGNTGKREETGINYTAGNDALRGGDIQKGETIARQFP